ncbi:hypothetical protein ACOMHN_036702 [Nucella lapillus]
MDKTLVLIGYVLVALSLRAEATVHTASVGSDYVLNCPLTPSEGGLIEDIVWGRVEHYPWTIRPLIDDHYSLTPEMGLKIHGVQTSELGGYYCTAHMYSSSNTYETDQRIIVLLVE